MTATVEKPKALVSAQTREEILKELEKLKEYGGNKDGLEPTRFGDWQTGGRVSDF